MAEIKEKIIEIVNRIPEVHVTNFGEVAKVVQAETNRRITAQLVGRQLSGLDEGEWIYLPWWRVVAKSGFVSSLKLGDKGRKQIQHLEQEGIPVENNMVDMKIYGITAEELQK